MKQVPAIKEDLDADGFTQSGTSDIKTYRHKSFDWKVGQRETRKKTELVCPDARGEEQTLVQEEKIANLYRRC